MYKPTLILVILLASLLAACAFAIPTATLPASTQTMPQPEATATEIAVVTEPTSVVEPTATLLPEPTHAAPETALYRDDQAGFELDYPVGWMLEASTEVGSRGSQGTLTSWGHTPGDVVTDRPANSTLVTLTVYQWDPKNDLAAFVTQRKLAWEASGFVVLSDEALTLSGLQPAQSFVIETPDKLHAFFLFTVVGDAYLQISADGDLAQARQIAITLRVFSQ